MCSSDLSHLKKEATQEKKQENGHKKDTGVTHEIFRKRGEFDLRKLRRQTSNADNIWRVRGQCGEKRRGKIKGERERDTFCADIQRNKQKLQKTRTDNHR